jgi:hypothetical protein
MPKSHRDGGLSRVRASIIRNRWQRTKARERLQTRMIRRRAAAADIDTKVGNHTFRATGISA